MATGINLQPICDTPIAIIDFETTGIAAGRDRVVEASIVRIDPGEKPRLVFDTLVNPCRKVSATDIHGITDEDVNDAPTFNEIAGDLVQNLEGCVLAAYNVYFDMKFLNFELANTGIQHDAPHFCLMYMRPMLNLGARCKLQDACDAHGVSYNSTHIAADDAMASGELMKYYLKELRQQNVSTFGDLSRLRKYKFQQSFGNDPFPSASKLNVTPTGRACSRGRNSTPVTVDPTKAAIRDYWDALKTVLADLVITDDELRHIKNERKRLGLAKEQIRMLHARAFSSAIAQFCEDEWLDDKELKKLRRLHQCLAELGWAPGQ